MRIHQLLLAGVACSLFGGSAWAERTSLVFDKINIVDLAKVAYGDLAKKPVIFTSEAVKAQETVSLTLHNVDREQALEQVGELLKKAGYSVETRAGVVWIDKAVPTDEDEMFYRPKFRATTYLLDMLTTLFKAGAFTLQRSAQPQSTPLPFPVTSQQGQIHDQGGLPLLGAPQATSGMPWGGQQQSGQSPWGYDNNNMGVAQPNPDAFLFRGTQQERDRLKRLLAQIDIPTPEILIKAVVFEVSTDSSDQSAMALAAQILGGKLGISLGSLSTGDYSALFKGTNFQAVFNALATDRRFKAVSSPQLRVQSGASAQLTVGSDTPVLGAVNYDVTGKAIQSVEYKSSGVILNLKPQIREEVADLQISQQISNFIQTTTGVNNSPTLIKRELQTTVGIKSDDVLVLGGMDQDTATNEHAGLSFLPSWFGTKSDARSKTEVLLILQATRL